MSGIAKGPVIARHDHALVRLTFVARCLLVTAVFLAINWLLLNRDASRPRWDERYHIVASRNVATNMTRQTLTAYNDSKGPMYHVLYGGWLRLTDGDLAATRALSALLSLVTCAFLAGGLARRGLLRMEVFLGLPLAPYFGVVGVMHMSEPVALLGMFVPLMLIGSPAPVSRCTWSVVSRWAAGLGGFFVGLTTRVHVAVLGVAGVVEALRGRRFAAAAALGATTAVGVAVYWILLGGYVRQTEYHTTRFAMGIHVDTFLYGIALLGVYTWPLLLDLRKRDLRPCMGFAIAVLVAWAAFAPEVEARKFYGLVRSTLMAVPGLSGGIRTALLVPAATAGALVLYRAARAILAPAVDPTWRMAALAGAGGLALYLIGPDLLYDRYLLMVVPLLQVPLLALSSRPTGWVLSSYQALLAASYVICH